MREDTKPSRWRVRLNFVARLKNKFNKKVEVDTYFCNAFFPEQTPPPPTAAATESHAGQGEKSWSTVPSGQFDNEASGSNHTSTQNSQYFDAEDTSEYLQQHQLPSFANLNLRGRSSQPGMPAGVVIPASNHAFQQDLEAAGDGMLIDLPTSHDQDFLRDVEHHQHLHELPLNEYDIFSGECADQSEFTDAVTEMQHRDEPMSSWQPTNSNYSHGVAPSMSMQMSGDTVETGDSNMTDTGDSNSNASNYILPPHPEPRHTVRFKQYLERVQRILFEEEFRSPRRLGRGWRVVASIVCSYRKISELLRTTRMQRTASSTMSGQSASESRMKRIRSTESCSKLYIGIKKRTGKWVAEIRVSKTTEKVWLGSFVKEKEAALAYDAGLHHCSLKRNKKFNFKESPHNLGPSQYSSLLALSKDERKSAVQMLANDHANAYGSSDNTH